LGVEDPQLTRTLFGYRRDKVRSLLADREAMFARVTEDARAAAEKVDTAEEQARAAEERAQTAEERAAKLVEESARAAEDKIRAAEEKVRAAESKGRAGDEQVRVAQEKTRVAEERLLELDAELARVRRELEERAEAPARTVDGEPVFGSLVAAGLPAPEGGLTAVLEATEKAVTQFIEEARHSGEEQLREAQRQQQELETKIAQLSEWWNRVEPFVADVQGSIDEAKNEANSVPGRIGSVLEPVTQAFGSLGSRLATLAEMAAMPITGTPDADGGPETSPPSVVDVHEPEAVEVGEPDEDVVVDPGEKVDHPGRWW
jgi:DNA repair exonuclease SbcCD ATPase subunit